MSSKTFKPPEGKSMKPQQKVARDYGKKQAYNTMRTQQGDGLTIPGVTNLMKLPSTKLKQSDIFDEKGDGKPSKKDPEKVEKKSNTSKSKRVIYSYKKRI